MKLGLVISIFAVLFCTFVQVHGADLNEAEKEVTGFIRIPGDSRSRGTQTTYWQSLAPSNYYGAIATCGSNGWNLVSIETKSKQDEFKQKVIFNTTHVFSPLWTSGRKVDGRWIWENGTPANYQNFAPIYGELGGDCVQVLPVSDQDVGKWVGADCNVSYEIFVCESKEFNVFPTVG